MKIKLIDENCILTKGYSTDAGWDLRTREFKIIEPMETYTFNTGICIEIPIGYSGDVKGRSSMNKQGILTHYGTIDFGYTGEIQITITNLSGKDYKVNKYDRIAQLVISKICEDNSLEAVDELSKSARGEKGFGSTGK